MGLSMCVCHSCFVLVSSAWFCLRDVCMALLLSACLRVHEWLIFAVKKTLVVDGESTERISGALCLSWCVWFCLGVYGFVLVCMAFLLCACLRVYAWLIFALPCLAAIDHPTLLGLVNFQCTKSRVCVCVRLCACAHVYVCVFVCLSISYRKRVYICCLDKCACVYIEIRICKKVYIFHHDTGWRRPVRCLKLHVTLHKRATDYRALLRKTTYKDKASYESSPLCTLKPTSFPCSLRRS